MGPDKTIQSELDIAECSVGRLYWSTSENRRNRNKKLKYWYLGNDIIHSESEADFTSRKQEEIVRYLQISVFMYFYHIYIWLH